MRLNLKNAIRFEAFNEQPLPKLTEEDLKRDTSLHKRVFFCSDRNMYIKKSKLEVYFDNSITYIYFENVNAMEKLIEKAFPENYEGIDYVI